MLRIIIFLTVIIIFLWAIKPLLKKKGSIKKPYDSEKSKTPNQYNLQVPKMAAIISIGVLSAALMIWLFPKLGISVLPLMQKLISTVISMRNVLSI